MRRFTAVLLAVLIGACLAPAPACRAAEADGASAELEAIVPGPSLDIPWGRVVGGTAAVVGLILGGYYLARRLNGGLPLTRGRYLEVIEARPIGGRVQLYLVRVAGRVVLLAANGDNVAAVGEFDGADLPEPVDDQTQAGAFAAIFRKLGSP